MRGAHRYAGRTLRIELSERLESKQPEKSAAVVGDLRGDSGCDSVLGMSMSQRHPGEHEQTLAERAEELEHLFRQRLREEGIAPSGDDRVGEAAAAMLLGFKSGSLANMRQQDRAPRAYKLGRGVYYRVSDLAGWLAGNIEVF